MERFDDTTDSPPPTLDELRAQVDLLRAELVRLHDRLGAGSATGPAEAGTSRRSLFGLAGASAIGAIGASLSTGRPAAAADPNDVVKNVANPVVGATTLTGGFNAPVLGLFNTAPAGDASALYMLTQSSDAPTLRADNDGADGLGGVAVAANAPGGRDVHARGSGRIAMVDHAFSSANQYSTGEFHQSGGTFYAMVSPSARQVIAAPGSVGALTLVEPRRVYDSRTPLPDPGRLVAGQSRVVSVADGRSVADGSVNVGDLVPPDATAIVCNLTAVGTSGSGFLSVTPAPATSVNASTLNWTSEGAVVANFSVVGLVGGRAVRVHCGGAGTTDFVIDVLGYHR